VRISTRGVLFVAWSCSGDSARLVPRLNHQTAGIVYRGQGLSMNRAECRMQATRGGAPGRGFVGVATAIRCKTLVRLGGSDGGGNAGEWDANPSCLLFGGT